MTTPIAHRSTAASYGTSRTSSGARYGCNHVRTHAQDEENIPIHTQQWNVVNHGAVLQRFIVEADAFARSAALGKQKKQGAEEGMHETRDGPAGVPSPEA